MLLSLIRYHYRQNYLRAHRNLILPINLISKGNRQIQGVGKQSTEQICGPASAEIARVRRKLRNVEFYEFILLNIVRIIKSWRHDG